MITEQYSYLGAELGGWLRYTSDTESIKYLHSLKHICKLAAVYICCQKNRSEPLTKAYMINNPPEPGRGYRSKDALLFQEEKFWSARHLGSWEC